MNKNNFLKNKKFTLSFGGFSLLSGLFFLGQGSITGNTIVRNEMISNPSFIFSLIGSLLIVCSFILFYYTISQKK
ncbi:hypothetical protein COU57_02655 [Candidatus Pacearchaeota archaeon CG10_big_fil_rev_8_21_14_0_10_32_14]|nr:MAG: hypothetical protein COU57_02655 [Candidatus Pacearchaeota archaeon CG10_big_fil_rev_8_21_14_0_10_32_14]